MELCLICIAVILVDRFRRVGFGRGINFWRSILVGDRLCFADKQRSQPISLYADDECEERGKGKRPHSYIDNCDREKRNMKTYSLQIAITNIRFLGTMKVLIRQRMGFHMFSTIKKVQVGKDQEKAQSAKDSHSQNPRWEKTKLTIRYLYHENIS